MKKCEEIKSLILTDYIDGCAERKASEELESHLLDCLDCRSFFKEVKNTVGMPFQQSAVQPVPAALWAAVRENLEQEKANPLADFLDRLKELLVFPRLVPVLGSLAFMLIAGSVTWNMVQLRQAKDQAQGEYLVSLLNSGNASTDSEAANPIEHYFL